MTSQRLTIVEISRSVRQGLNQLLVNTGTQLEIIENEENININSNTYKITTMRKQQCLFTVFTFVIFGYFCAMYFVQAILAFYTKNTKYYFYCLLFLTSFFKLLLKHIAKKIDINNMNCNHSLKMVSLYIHGIIH